MCEKRLSYLIGNLLIDEAMDKGVSMIKDNIDPVIFQNEITEGLSMVEENYNEGKCFIADLMVAGVLARDLFNLANLANSKFSDKTYVNGKVVIGTIAGDIHDIGKNLIADALTYSNVEVIDLGIDVSISDFVNAVEKHKPAILAISTIMDSSFSNIKELITILKKKGFLKNMKVVVGGAAADERYIKIKDVDLLTNDYKKGMKYCLEILAKVPSGGENE